MRKLLLFLILSCSFAFSQITVGGNAKIGGAVTLGASSGGGVTVDAVGPSSSGTSTGCGAATWTTCTLSWSHTVSSSHSNLALCVGVGLRDGSAGGAVATWGATYNSVAMTEEYTAGGGVGLGVGGSTGQGTIQLFCLKNPSTGTNTVSVTATYSSGTRSTTDSLMGGSVCFYNVNQTTPVVNIYSATGDTASVSVVATSSANDLVLDLASTWNSTLTSTQTQQWQFVGGSSTNGTASSTAAGATSVTMGYTISVNQWAILAVDIGHS